jgi:hypothetical protein
MLAEREALGIGMTAGASASSQVCVITVDVGACLVGGLVDRAVTFCVTLRVRDTAERAPGQEGEAELGAVLEFFPAGAEAGENWS